MTLALHLGLLAYLAALACGTTTACEAHLRDGYRVEAAVDAGYTLVLAVFAAVVVVQVWP